MPLFAVMLETSHPAATVFLAQFSDSHFGPPGASTMFSAIPALILFVFVLVIGTFLFRMVRGVTEWSANNESPRLTVPARVVTKRADTSVSAYNHQPTVVNRIASTTRYFVTFEYASGDRQEFSLTAAEYGLLAEEDTGYLTSQGTRYLGFERTSQPPHSTAPEAPVAPPVPGAGASAFCPFCGQDVAAGYKFCPHCGKPQPGTAPS